MQKQDLAPIVFIAYNRPEHAKKALQSLKANPLSAQSKLYYHVDGPKPDATPEERVKIQAVVDLAKEENWCAEVEVIAQKENKGLTWSIIDVITDVLAKHGKAIIVEDDLQLGKGFLQYMNDALNLYKEDREVMHISAYMYPVNPEGLPKTFFYNSTSCWGWGTWKESWDHLNTNPEELIVRLAKKNLFDKLTLDGKNMAYLNMIASSMEKLHTWDILWNASMLIAGGYALHPAKTLTSNTGTDGSGAHKDHDVTIARQQASDEILMLSKIELKESDLAIDRMKAYYTSQYAPSLMTKVKSKIKTLFG